MGKFTLWVKTLPGKDNKVDARALALRNVGLFAKLSFFAFQQHVLIRIRIVTIGRVLVNAIQILSTCFLAVQSVATSAHVSKYGCRRKMQLAQA